MFDYASKLIIFYDRMIERPFNSIIVFQFTQKLLLRMYVEIV